VNVYPLFNFIWMIPKAQCKLCRTRQ